MSTTNTIPRARPSRLSSPRPQPCWTKAGEGLAQIEAALERIDAGTYGICAVCRDEIAEGRLEARPWTPYCIRHSAGPAGPPARARA